MKTEDLVQNEKYTFTGSDGTISNIGRFSHLILTGPLTGQYDFGLLVLSIDEVENSVAYSNPCNEPKTPPVPHKWAKEIKAWADGYQIQAKYPSWKTWVNLASPNWKTEKEIFRVKPENDDKIKEVQLQIDRINSRIHRQEIQRNHLINKLEKLQ